MPRWWAERPRQIFPPPMTTATSTPRSCTSLICEQTCWTISGEILSMAAAGLEGLAAQLQDDALVLRLEGLRGFFAGSRGGHRAQIEHEARGAWEGKSARVKPSAQCPVLSRTVGASGPRGITGNCALRTENSPRFTAEQPARPRGWRPGPASRGSCRRNRSRTWRRRWRDNRWRRRRRV